MEDGDSCWVTIRNPRLIAGDELRAMAGKRDDAGVERITAAKAALDAGEEIPEGLITEEDAGRGYDLIARLVIGWHVWDTTVPVKLDDQGNPIEDDETAPRLLPLPATPELVGKLPQEILAALMEELSKLNPPTPQADGTGKMS